MRKFFIVSAVILAATFALHLGIMPATGQAETKKTEGDIDPHRNKPCARCHPSKVEGKYLHGPVGSKECTPCHKVSKDDHQQIKGLFGTKEKGAKLCYMCHENVATMKTVHAPVKDGDCIGCHDPHGSPYKKQLKAGGADLCFNCHDKGPFKKKFGHAPVEAGDCLDCHVPHQSKAAKLIKPSEGSICLTCHDKSLVTGKSVHAPVAEGDCGGCHAVHGADYPKLLKGAFSSEYYLPYSDANYALCFTCHDAKSMTEKETTSSTSFRNGKQNLHYLHVNNVKGRSCKLCHNFHASTQAKLIKEKAKGTGNMDITIIYNETANGGTCMVGCHKIKSYDRVKAIDYNSPWK